MTRPRLDLSPALSAAAIAGLVLLASGWVALKLTGGV